MTNPLKLSVFLEGIDRATKPFLGVIKTTKTLQATITASQKQLDSLTAYKTLRTEFTALQPEITKTRKQLDLLTSNQKMGARLTVDQKKQIKSLTAKLDTLKIKRADQIRTLRTHASQLNQAGISSRTLTRSNPN